MEAAERGPLAPPTDLAAVIERTATDFGLAEEPAHFLVVLDGEDEPPPPREPESGRG